MKKLILLLLMTLAFFSVAAYTGPAARTISTGECKIVLHECMLVSKGWRWHQIDDWSCSNESKPWQSYPELVGQACDPGSNGNLAWSRNDTSSSVTYEPVSVSHSLTCGLPGNADWCRGGLTLSLSASEPIPGQVVRYFESAAGVLCDPADAASVTCSTPLGLEGEQAASFWAVSSYGDTSLMRSYSWKLDASPPANTSSSPAPNGANGWYVADLNISLSGTDATSGIDPGRFRYQLNGGAWQNGTSLSLTSDGVHTVNTEAYDIAGNLAARTVTIRLDKTPPTVSPASAGSLQNGWYNTPVSSQANASDATSGIASVEYQLNGGAWQPGESVTVASDGTHQVTFRAADQAGHVTQGNPISFSIDRTPPVVTHNLPAPDGLNGWYVSPPTIPLAALDMLSGVRPGSLEYRLNSLDWTTAESITVLADGYHILEARAEDLAGNRGQTAFDLRVDTTDPEIEITVTAALPQQNGWYVSPATATAFASDATSGLAAVEYQVETTAAVSTTRAGRFRQVAPAWVPGSSLTLADGLHQVSMRASDQAGNMQETTRQVRVDSTAPVSTFGAINRPLSGMALLSGTSTDAVSGIARVEYSLDDGGTWQTITYTEGVWAIAYDTTQRPDGQYTLLVRATDRAGHTESPISLVVTVNNAPLKVSLSEWWWIWESGELSVQPGNTALESIRLQIGCGALPDVVIEFDSPDKLPADFTWNRRCGDGTLAESGEYAVTLTACDLYGQCASATGSIRIPAGLVTATPTPTTTPTQEPSPTHSAATPSATPTLMMLSTVTVEAPPSPEPATQPWPTWLLPLMALLGILLVLGWNSLRDPRPAALCRLRASWQKVSQTHE